jgi:putative DNA primase/helicase
MDRTQIIEFYLERGLIAVPTRPDERAPTSRWKQIATDEQARAEWAKAPDNVQFGVLCGPSRVLVVDLDAKNPEVAPGIDALTAWISGETGVSLDIARQQILDHPVQAKTCRGGTHLYYQLDKDDEWPDHSTTLVGVLPQVDLRGRGGFVVSPPSKLDGGRYSWKQKFHRDDIPFVPPWLFSLVDAHAERKRTPAKPRTPVDRPRPPMQTPDAFDVSAAAEHHLEQAIQSVQAGGRSGANTKGFELAIQLRDLRLSESEAQSYMDRYRQAVPSDPSRHDYSDKEAVASLRQAYGTTPRDPAVPREAFPLQRGNLRVVPQTDDDYENVPPTQDVESPEPNPDGTTTLPCPPEGFQPILEKTLIQKALAGERGLGTLAAMMFKDRFLFDHSAGTWFQWKEHYWQECRTGEQIAELANLQELIKTIAFRKRPKKGATKDGEKAASTGLADQLMSAADSMKKLTTTKAVLQFAASGKDGLGIAGDEWDHGTEYELACANGVIDLRTGALRPGRPSDRMKAVCPTPYDPDAKAPRFDRFISEIMPDRETAEFLKRFLGYGISGSVRDHVFAVFWGSKGRNGKDTLLESILATMGGLAAPINAKCLMDQNYSPDHDSSLLDLRGRRMVWASESGDRQKLEAAKVKLWSGGGTLKGRAPYGAYQIEFQPTHKLILISNFKPQVGATDEALWQRILLIPFVQQFVENPQGPLQHQRDPGLAETLVQEKQGILRWLVDGCMEWIEDGLCPPQSVKAATETYRNEEDAIGLFIADCLRTDPASRVTAKAMHDCYLAWNSTSGEGRPLGPRKFMKAMKDKGYDTGHSREGKVFPGLRLGEDA